MLLKRTLAFLIDFFIGVWISLATIFLFGFLFPLDNIELLRLPIFFSFVIFYFVWLLLPPFFGNSFGKMIYGLKITNYRREPISFKQTILRSLAWPLVGPIEIIIAYFDSSYRRLGDFFAKTIVFENENINVLKRTFLFCISFLIFHYTLQLIGLFSVKFNESYEKSFNVYHDYFDSQTSDHLILINFQYETDPEIANYTFFSINEGLMGSSLEVNLQRVDGEWVLKEKNEVKTFERFWLVKLYYHIP